MAHALKSPNSPKAFSKDLFIGEVREGLVSCCKLLGVRSFVLEVRSWSGNNVPVNLHQTNVILCSDKKGQGPKAQLSPSKVQVLAKRRQISVGGSLRARSPDPAQLSSLREPGTQDPTGPQAPQAAQMAGARSRRLCPMQTAAAIRSWR